MAEYKTVAGPIDLTAQSGEDYYAAVKQYAKIIDAEAVGGWELHLIQQIAVKKLLWYTVGIGAILGAILGLVFALNIMGDSKGPNGLLIGAIAGAALGCFGIKNVTEFFNMLIFVKRDGSAEIHDSGHSGAEKQINLDVIAGVHDSGNSSADVVAI